MLSLSHSYHGAESYLPCFLILPSSTFCAKNINSVGWELFCMAYVTLAPGDCGPLAGRCLFWCNVGTKYKFWFGSVWVKFSRKAPSLHVGRTLVVDLLLNYWSSSVWWEWIYLFFPVYHCTKIISKYTEASTAVICVFWCVLWHR